MCWQRFGHDIASCKHERCIFPVACHSFVRWIGFHNFTTLGPVLRVAGSFQSCSFKSDSVSICSVWEWWKCCKHQGADSDVSQRFLDFSDSQRSPLQIIPKSDHRTFVGFDQASQVFATTLTSSQKNSQREKRQKPEKVGVPHSPWHCPKRFQTSFWKKPIPHSNSLAKGRTHRMLLFAISIMQNEPQFFRYIVFLPMHASSGKGEVC